MFTIKTQRGKKIALGTSISFQNSAGYIDPDNETYRG